MYFIKCWLASLYDCSENHDVWQQSKLGALLLQTAGNILVFDNNLLFFFLRDKNYRKRQYCTKIKLKRN